MPSSIKYPKKYKPPSNTTIWNWWKGMSLISGINLFIVSYVIYRVYNIKKNHRDACVIAAWLAFVYVVVCGFRSVLPRIDNSRICLFDSSISTPFVGRSVATIAELSFIMLIIICMTRLSFLVQSCSHYTSIPSLTTHLSLGAGALIIIAEILSWTGCLTDYELWNAAEELLWAIAASILLFGIILLYICARECMHADSLRYILITTAVSITAYIVFMLKIDVPMYIRKWKEREDTNRDGNMSWGEFSQDFKTTHKKGGSLFDRFRKMHRCDKVTDEYNVWKEDLPWFTAYFILAAWAAILMCLWYINTFE